MKKVIVLVIAVIYLASIVAVNFFGLKVPVFEGTTYVKDIVLNAVVHPDINGDGSGKTLAPEDPETKTRTIGGENYYLFPFTFKPAPEGKSYTAENIEENPNTVYLDITVYPFNATNDKIEFIFDGAATAGSVVFVEEKRTIVFLKPFTASVFLRALDGSGVETKPFYIRFQ